MPFTDPISSVSGRNSRASNISAVTGASRSVRSQPTAVPQHDTLASAGVLSMLKTSTDTGDIGALSFNKSRLPGMPRTALPTRRPHHRPRHSGVSNPAAMPSHHHYAPSQTSGVSSSREWDSASNQRRGSLTSMQSMPPSLPAAHLGRVPMQMPLPPPDEARDSRSYSMTSAPTAQQLHRHRSGTSLKSQGHEPRHPPPRSRPPQQPMPMPMPMPMLENRPQYVYPTRLKRPGYRSPSPALSDTYTQAPPPALPTMERRPPMPGQRPLPPQSYNSDYGTDYNNDPRHLHVRPQPKVLPHGPVMGYGEVPHHFAYRNPAAVRSAPGLVMPLQPSGPGGPPHPAPLHHMAGIHPVMMPQYPPMMPRAPYPGPHFAQRPGYPPYPPMPHRGPPPSSSAVPIAHQIFHNAARMARHLPQRTDTPLTDAGPPSSDPPSSGTAPTASGPPTPKDQSTIQVVVDPAFIDPALIDLPDSSSEPVLPHKYFRYADGLEQDIEEADIEAVHPSVPPSGFVQRVKAMLESKAAADAAANNEAEREKLGQHRLAQDECIELEVEEDQEVHELAANETPRFTIIEEFNAPVELPASPVRLPELSGSPIQHRRRITRDMVKAELATSSVDNTITHTEGLDTKCIEIITLHHFSGRAEEGENAPDIQEPRVPAEDAPSTPGPVANKADGGLTADSTSASSPDVLRLSAADYAISFNVAVDTTSSSDETQSKDPFILDADTITLQHQRSKEKPDTPEQVHHEHEEGSRPKTALLESQSDVEPPVSPLMPGEDVSRCSAVSPLQTQTLGIEETLLMASEPVPENTVSTAEEQTIPGAYPEETQPPPTPRTPKTYSKSVQLHPSTTFPDTPSSNRFSLPPDLSTVGETTEHTTSDMVTDVAVRFSLPQTTVTVTKPQIIEIPPTSSPEQPPPTAPRPALPTSHSKSKRSSVTFADEIAPLKVNKRIEHQNATQKSAEAALHQGRSIIRRASPKLDSADISRISRDSTPDLRFPVAHGLNGRFESTYLPGLKEESIEDMSISDKRASDIASSFQFPLPSRIAAVKAMQERRLQESAEKAKARRAARYPRPLAEIRDLPSLNFSRMDLIDKLNQALEVRSSKSMEVLHRREISTIYCPSPQRPMSTEPLRDRYISFFSKPEEFSSFFDDPGESEECDETEIDFAPGTGVPTVEVQPNTEIDLENVEDSHRALSPQDFLTVATQVDRLSIPSVNGLSERLSELLPNLRDLPLDSVLANFEEVAEDIRRLGDGVRPETVLSSRTSAGFRTLAERAEEIVKNGTHDSTVPVPRLIGTNKDLPPLPESMSADKVSAVNSVDGKQSYLSGSVSAPSDLGKEPTRPASALTRHKSPVSQEEVHALLPPEMNPITRNSKRAIIMSSASSRPWNQDENYPWAGTKVDVDLTVPSQAHTRDSVTSDVLRKLHATSLEVTTSSNPTETTKGIDIGSILEQGQTESITNEQLTGVSDDKSKQSKRSVIGSITKKIGLGNRADANTTRNPSSTASLVLAEASSSSQPHRPGERYPTSGLTPPAGFNLEEVRSFFSDNSSEKERNASFRKRLTNLKGKGKVVRLDQGRGHSLDGNTAYDGGEMTVERVGATSSAQTYDGVGMGRTEFHIKRFGEKLRHLLAKGGELIRSWSTRSKAPRLKIKDEDWLSDSLYSGV